MSANSRRFPRRKLRIEAFFGFVFLLVIAYIIGYFYTNAQRPEVSQMRVEMGAVSQPMAFDGIIIRDEVVYRASDAGSLMFHVENHERVRAGRVVASIQDAGLVANYRANLASIDQDAVNAQRQRTGVAINEEEIAMRNLAIMQYIDNAAFGIAAGDVGGIFALGDAARQSMQNRNMLYFTDEIAMMDYASARERALAGMTQAISEVAAVSSGIFSNMVDGLEEQLTVSNLANISRETIQGAMQSPVFYSPEVEAGDALFRIVRTNDWFIAAFVHSDYTESWSRNTTVTLYIEDGLAIIPLVAQVHSIAEAVQGEVYVVFRTNNDLMRFIDRRNIIFRLARDAQEGFKIPHDAIVERSRFPVPAEYVFIENNVWAVNLIAGDRIVTESVSGSFSADGQRFFIMADNSGLRVGDTLILQQELFEIEADDSNLIPSHFVFVEGSGWAVDVSIDGSIVTQPIFGRFSNNGLTFQMEEGGGNLRAGDVLARPEERFLLETIDTVSGVFVTNIGATQFREVSTEGFFAKNADYIILDPANNPNLRLFDRIVADARAVGDRLLLH